MIFDVAVVGAGPAGAVAAKVAAKRGLSVVVLEKARFPRHKACAGGVTIKSLRQLEELGIELSTPVVEREIRGVRFFGNGSDFTTGRVDERVAVTVRRNIFDEFLIREAERAGAELIEGAEVTDLGQRKNHVRLSTGHGDFFARFVIGADGVNSAVAKASGIRKRWRRWELALALVADVPVGEGFVEREMEDFFELYCIHPVWFGFGWVFPYKEHLSIGIGGITRNRHDLIARFHEFAARVGRIKGIDLSDLRPNGHFVPAGGFRRRIASGRILLAGDAAGFVDPFSGEGIYHAIRSGRIAGECVAGAALDPKGRPLRLSRVYTRRCYGEFLTQMRLSLFTSILLGRKGENVFEFVKHHPSMVFRVTDIMTRPAAYSEIVLGNVWRLPRMMFDIAVGKGKG